jgi:DNA-directed RNA polymerase subunit L
MEIKILNEEKGKMDVEIDSLTVVEVLRAYLNKDATVGMAAWRREHPTKNPILHIESSNPKKSLRDAVGAIQKELKSISDDFKKMK